jgi:hypothetical protein
MGRTGADVSVAVKLTDQAGAAFRDIAVKAQGSAGQMERVHEAISAIHQADSQPGQAVDETGTIARRNQQAPN